MYYKVRFVYQDTEGETKVSILHFDEEILAQRKKSLYEVMKSYEKGLISNNYKLLSKNADSISREQYYKEII